MDPELRGRNSRRPSESETPREALSPRDSMATLAGKPFRAFILSTLLILPLSYLPAQRDKQTNGLGLYPLLGEAFSRDRRAANQAIDELERSWQSSYLAPLLEVFALKPRPAADLRIRRLIADKTGQRLRNVRDWQVWTWNRPEALPPDYAAFKASLYTQIDPAFARYFAPTRKATIRLDEIVWGGVVQDGIPPLRQPKMIPAKQADYLRDKHIVFGIEVNGDARAYPKRILAWHEMFVDTVGEVEVAGVYCTLCGTVILYETKVDGIKHELGTSGFLYRSNKLMYDRATHSLWSALEGRPVVGPLVGQGIQLPWRSVITTTWGEWKKRHPDTRVLSLDTGHERDYSEGAAYRDYFSTDRLMFPVPTPDKRLANKDEILALTTLDRAKALAISARFLRRNPIYHVEFAGLDLLVLTDKTGGNRVYQIEPGERFALSDEDGLLGPDGRQWQTHESALLGPEGEQRKNYPAHRAFWFGWHSQFPDTRLIDHRGAEREADPEPTNP